MLSSEITKRTQDLINTIALDSKLNEDDRLYIQNFIKESCIAFPRYIMATNEYVLTVHSILKSRENGDISQEEFERELENVDTSRRTFHNKAIDACNQLNRLCEKYGLEKICDIETSNRAAVANFTSVFSMAIHEYALNHNYTTAEVIKQIHSNQEQSELEHM